jgi:hypothetical protein
MMWALSLVSRFGSSRLLNTWHSRASQGLFIPARRCGDIGSGACAKIKKKGNVFFTFPRLSSCSNPLSISC